MKVLFTKEEMFAVIKKSIPQSMIPEGQEISDISDNGYRGFEVSFEKKVAENKEES
jgi:hypothetical protein